MEVARTCSGFPVFFPGTFPVGSASKATGLDQARSKDQMLVDGKPGKEPDQV